MFENISYSDIKISYHQYLNIPLVKYSIFQTSRFYLIGKVKEVGGADSLCQTTLIK
ncbi:MAG: hypothetical protein ACI9XO_001242 [Paraglaciecola sp.]|jgi:hypothetical protein